jgi:hypothetical protein
MQKHRGVLLPLFIPDSTEHVYLEIFFTNQQISALNIPNSKPTIKIKSKQQKHPAIFLTTKLLLHQTKIQSQQKQRTLCFLLFNLF